MVQYVVQFTYFSVCDTHHANMIHDKNNNVPNILQMKQCTLQNEMHQIKHVTKNILHSYHLGIYVVFEKHMNFKSILAR